MTSEQYEKYTSLKDERDKYAELIKDLQYGAYRKHSEDERVKKEIERRGHSPDSIFLRFFHSLRYRRESKTWNIMPNYHLAHSIDIPMDEDLWKIIVDYYKDKMLKLTEEMEAV